LYNFKKAPKNYVDDDSFINNHDVWTKIIMICKFLY
jgi:hypothetical protein